MIEEAKIILEVVVVALEASNPDIKTIRRMIAEADELLARSVGNKAKPLF